MGNISQEEKEIYKEWLIAFSSGDMEKANILNERLSQLNEEN
jgi:hypothetical protein